MALDPRQQELVERWDARGRPDCTHEDYERHEVLTDALPGIPPHDGDTGDYICKSCGAAWYRESRKPGLQAAATHLEST